MAQRDYEEQPEAPDLGASIQLDNADTLAGPPGDGDALDAGYVAADRPYVLDDDAVTGRGMREGESLDDRLAREVPEDAGPGDPDRAGRIGIAEPGTGDATEGVDVGIDGGAASAEEAAVHRVDGNSRVDGEPSVAAVPALADPEVDALITDGDGGGGSAAEDGARADATRDAARGLDADRS